MVFGAFFPHVVVQKCVSLDVTHVCVRLGLENGQEKTLTDVSAVLLLSSLLLSNKLLCTSLTGEPHSNCKYQEGTERNTVTSQTTINALCQQKTIIQFKTQKFLCFKTRTRDIKQPEFKFSINCLPSFRECMHFTPLELQSRQNIHVCAESRYVNKSRTEGSSLLPYTNKKVGEGRTRVREGREKYIFKD